MAFEVDNSPLGSSRRRTGRRYFAVANDALYNQLADTVAALRNWPDEYTARAIPEASELPHDSLNRVLFSAEVWRFTEGDDEMLSPVITAGLVVELTVEEYTELLPPPIDI